MTFSALNLDYDGNSSDLVSMLKRAISEFSIQIAEMNRLISNESELKARIVSRVCIVASPLSVSLSHTELVLRNRFLKDLVCPFATVPLFVADVF